MPRSVSNDDATVDLWVARPASASGAELVARYRALLSPDEAERAAGFRFEEHRHEFLVTRALVRTTLSEYREVAPADWRFAKGEYGRPAITPPCGLHFNLSNTASLVVCAVSEHRELGVDVEHLARAADILEVADTVFTDAEIAALRTLPPADARERAVTLWTCKEAYMKARGMGMSLPPKEISLRWGDGEAPRVLVASALDDGRAWMLRTIDVDGHRVALCVQGAGLVRVAIHDVVPLQHTTEGT